MVGPWASVRMRVGIHSGGKPWSDGWPCSSTSTCKATIHLGKSKAFTVTTKACACVLELLCPLQLCTSGGRSCTGHLTLGAACEYMCDLGNLVCALIIEKGVGSPL